MVVGESCVHVAVARGFSEVVLPPGDGGCRFVFCVGLMAKHVILTCEFPMTPGHGVWNKNTGHRTDTDIGTIMLS